MATSTPAAPFDIVATYKRLLAEDSELTMPVAAIEALIQALAATPASTVSETLDRVSTLTATLKRGIPNSISLSAGTDLFQQYLITSLQRPAPSSSGIGGGGAGGAGAGGAPIRGGGASDFEQVRAHLIQNGKLFVARAKAARTTIASFGRHFIRDGTTVLTNGGSRVVGALLQSAAGAPPSSSPPSDGSASGAEGVGGSRIRFRVIYVVGSADADASESAANVAALRARDIPVATIPPTAVAHCLDRVTQCFVGAEGVVENGGIISRMGTFQLGTLARAAGKPFYVVCESHKFVRLYPIGQRDLGLKQRVVDFWTDRGQVADEEDEEDGGGGDEGVVADIGKEDGKGPEKAMAAPVARVDDFVDYTPPNLITGIITESGVLLPSAVSEELIKIWF